MTGRIAFAAFLMIAISGLPAFAADTPAAAQGVLPTGADGKALNLDFETGTLADWTAEGNAFEGQPIKGDTVVARRPDMKSNHQGQYWIGGFEKLEDKGTGTLSSAPFKVTHRWAMFLLAGGDLAGTRVELISAADGKPFFTARGHQTENLSPVLVDLEIQQGQQIRIRLIDQETGGWGHINFDDFRFYDQKPVIKAPADGGGELLVADQFKFEGLPADDAAKEMTLPPGFKASVIAAEPDIINPIAFCIDARGRIWVVQSLTYPVRAPEGQGKDSIFIFEDQGDGKRWKKSVFMEGLNLVSGIEVGFGGVWIGAAPYMMFIPAKENADGSTVPAGKPEILLDGFGYGDTHETLNSFIWGPDGWLYGCHGVFTDSLVGKPGAPKEERVHINAGVWRYHPTKHIFERFAEGTSNPWGMDFDEHGQIFMEACVIPHLWHMIQNARYQRQGGQHDDPYTFDDIKQIADHVHFLGSKGPHAGNGKSDAAGGGHAHSGMMVYLGDNWPDEYRGKLFMNNIHGARINMDIPEPQGSGFVGHHGKDFLLANDRASQILAMKYGPDGSVYMIDWYDLNQCHSPNPAVHDKTTGRIFRVAYGDVKAVKVDLEKLSDSDLVERLPYKNAWYGRMAMRILAERAARRKLDHLAEIGIVDAIVGGAATPIKANGLLLARSCGIDIEKLAEALVKQGSEISNPSDEYFVGRAIELLAEDQNIQPEKLASLEALSKSTKSSVVRMYLASAAIRISSSKRSLIVESLLAHGEDVQDHNLPLMYWYALEPLLDVDPSHALDIASTTKIPNILAFSVRKLSMIGGPKELDALTARLAKTDKDSIRVEILRGMAAGLKGRRGVPAPAGWDEVASTLSNAKQIEIASQVRALSVAFGSKEAMSGLRRTLLDHTSPTPERLAALDSLTSAHDFQLALPLILLLDEPDMRAAALKALASYDNPQIPEAILKKYASFPTGEKKDALLTLAGRPAFATALLNAVGTTIPQGDISADILRQLRNLKNDDVSTLISKHWVAARETAADKLEKITKIKKLVGDSSMPLASTSHGRAVFAKTCAQCHTLFGEGGHVGPEITGSDRANLDYLLTNVVDPNAVIPADYVAWELTTKDDRSLTGILKKQDAQIVVLQTANELLTFPRSEVASLKASKLSMMPEGLLDNLPPLDVRDLIAYLRSPLQVPILADADTAKTLFNGKDLSGWESLDESLWSVEGGEIVGRTKTGIKANQFLTSKMSAKDFRLTVKIKLVPNGANSGIQFRSVRLPNSSEMRGCQADAGAGWWGKLYEESGRGILFPKKGQEFDGEKFLNKEDWNTYEVLAVGGKIRTAINGHLCTDLEDDQVAKEGIFGLQIHAGGPTEVRFKDFELEIDPKFELKTVK